MVLAGPAVEGEGKIRRVAQRGQDVPGRGNQDHNQQPAERAKPSPRLRGKQLAGKQEINQPGGHGKKDADEALEQEAQTEVCGQDEGPKTWMRFFRVECAKKRPHRQRHGKHQHHVGDQDPREQKQADTRGHA